MSTTRALGKMLITAAGIQSMLSIASVQGDNTIFVNLKDLFGNIFQIQMTSNSWEDLLPLAEHLINQLNMTRYMGSCAAPGVVSYKNDDCYRANNRAVLFTCGFPNEHFITTNDDIIAIMENDCDYSGFSRTNLILLVMTILFISACCCAMTRDFRRLQNAQNAPNPQAAQPAANAVVQIEVLPDNSAAKPPVNEGYPPSYDDSNNIEMVTPLSDVAQVEKSSTDVNLDNELKDDDTNLTASDNRFSSIFNNKFKYARLNTESEKSPESPQP